MRFTSILLLASAVSAVRIQHLSTMQVQDPTPEEIEAMIKKDPEAALEKLVDFIMEKCDKDESGDLSIKEAKKCIKKAEKKLPEDVKDEFPEPDEEDMKQLAKIAKDGKITKDELKETIKMAWEKYGPKE